MVVSARKLHNLVGPWRGCGLTQQDTLVYGLSYSVGNCASFLPSPLEYTAVGFLFIYFFM